jgi:hypothetical protein
MDNICNFEGFKEPKQFINKIECVWENKEDDFFYHDQSTEEKPSTIINTLNQKSEGKFYKNYIRNKQ